MFHKINLLAARQVVTSLSLDMLKDTDEDEISSNICQILNMPLNPCLQRSLGLVFARQAAAARPGQKSYKAP
jgi:hypothetical protein